MENETIGQRIGRLRERAGLTREQVAERLGVNRNTVGNWEQDRSSPCCRQLKQFCDIAGAVADEVLGRTQKPDEFAVLAVTALERVAWVLETLDTIRAMEGTDERLIRKLRGHLGITRGDVLAALEKRPVGIEGDHDAGAKMLSRLCKSEHERDMLVKFAQALLAMQDSVHTFLRFEHQNHRGEVAIRRCEPAKLWYGKTEWHNHDQWLLSGYDLDRRSVRTYALADVTEWLKDA